MDDTQRLDYNDDEEETTVNRDRPAGNLHMFAGIHGPAQDFPIYHGQNTIGRHANCDITLPAQSVSKKHAILQVRGDCHTICDNGSLNKTRRGKVALSPDVRYALANGDFLLFADVACRYTVQEKIEAETIGVEESEDDSVLVPPTQGALAIEKTPGAAIRRIARGAVLARDSGDEDEEEDRQTKRHEGGCGSFKDSLKTSSAGAIFPSDADTIVPESDEENDTSTSETHLPSLNLPSDSDTDTSRRSSFVPCSQNISTPVVLKDQSKLIGRTLTVVVKEEMESSKPTDAEIKLRLAVEDPPDSKKNQEEEKVESTSGGIVPEPRVELVDTTDVNVKKEQDCEKLVQDDALNKPSSESIPVSSPCGEDDNVASSKSETVQEAPSESNPKIDAPMQHNDVQLSDTDIKPKEENVSSDGESDIPGDATKSGIDVNTAETSGIQSNKTEEDGNGGALGSGGAEFHMDSDTDVDEDEASTTGPDLEKAGTKSEMEESENNENCVTGGNEGGSDSDTDVEDDLNVMTSKSDDEVNKIKDEPSKSEGTTGFGIDSDTDDVADLSKPAENNAEQDSKSNTEEKKEEFHMDSDTDVDSDVSTAEVKETEPESSRASGKETKDVSNLDSDTDVDEDVDVSTRDVTHGPQDSSSASTNVKEATGVDSDTDVDEDDQIPGGSDVALGKTSTDEPKVVAKEAAALHVDSDTDVDDDDVASEGITHTDSATTGSEMTKAAELHLDSDTDVEEGDAEEVDVGGVLENAGEDQKSLSPTDETVSGISTEQTKNVPAQIGTEEDETQTSESESIDLEMMPTQSFLEPQEEESELQDEEEATQAFILSSTWAEPDLFKRPADPIGVLQISSVTLNTSEEDFDENAVAETQAFCSEAELRGPSLQETPEPVERSVDETVQSSSGDESEKEAQQLPHEPVSQDATQPVSQDATQPVSQCLSGRPPQETGTWVHLKRDVPASVWIRGIQQEGEPTDLEGGKETAEDETQAYEQSLNLELEATQSYVEESPSLRKSPLQTDTPAVPTAEEDRAEPDVPSENIEQPSSEDTQASESDATQPYSPSRTVTGVDSGTAQASALSEETTRDGATQAVSIHPVATEDHDTQVVTPSVPAAEEVAPETSTKSKEKLSLRRGLSRNKKKEDPAQNVPTSSITEEPLDKGSAGPSSLKEEPDQQSTGKPQPSKPEIKEEQVEKEVRRRGGRRTAESQGKDTAKEDVPVAATSRKRTSKISSEVEPSTSGVSEQRGRRQVPRKSAKKEVNEELEEEHKQSSSNTEEIKESSAPEILPVNPPEIESVSSVDDKKGNAVQKIFEDSSDQASLKNKEMLCAEAPVSSTVIENEEPMEANDNSAEKEPDSRQNKKPARNKRRVATRLKNEADKEEDKEKNIGDHNLKTSPEKDTSKQTSKPLQTPQEESQGRKATRKSRVKPSEQDSDEGEDNTGTAEENKKAEEVGPAGQASGNEKSRRTRRSLKEDVKEESENVQEGKGRTRRSTSVKVAEPKHEEKGNEDMPESDKRPKRTRNNSKKDATNPEEVKEDVKTNENASVTKPTRARKNIKEEQQKPEDNNGTQETASSDSQTLRRTRREYREDKVVKEETVKETPSRRTRRHSKEEEAVKLEDQTKKSRRTRKDSMEEEAVKLEDQTKKSRTRKDSLEEEAVKLEDQTKKSRRTRKDSKEETKTNEAVDESPLDNEEEAVERKTTRKTRKNVKDDETSVNEKETKQTEHNSKSERSSRTRAKASEESKELLEDVEGLNKGAEESHKLSPPEETSKPARGRGRRAAEKEDLPQVSTPVASRKRGQVTKAEVEVKRKKSDEGEQEEPREVETPKSRRGRPRKQDTQQTPTRKDATPPDPSPSRNTRQRPSSALSNSPEARTPRRTNRMSTPAPATRLAQSGPAPKILFTGVVDTAGEETIRSLGGDIAKSVFDCTHLVTDRVRRTVKFLCALARGIPIVTLDWIDKCKKSGCFLSPTGFLVHDKEQEKNFNFLLSESLQKAKGSLLFEGYEIHVTANVKPEPDQMKDIICCSGATFLPKMPRTFKEKCVIVSCSEDAARCKSVPASVPITSAEFILSGILRQEVDPTAYLLSPADTGPTPAKRRR